MSQHTVSLSEYVQEILITTESQLDQLSSVHQEYDTETKINPNKYSTARWRWVWAIDKICISLRVNKCILAIWKRFFYFSFIFLYISPNLIFH